MSFLQTDMIISAKLWKHTLRWLVFRIYASNVVVMTASSIRSTSHAKWLKRNQSTKINECRIHMHSARRQLHIPIVWSIVTEEDWLLRLSACFDYFGVSKCAYSLRWIRSFATDLILFKPMTDIFGIFVRYLDVSETVSVECICKQTCKNWLAES